MPANWTDQEKPPSLDLICVQSRVREGVFVKRAAIAQRTKKEANLPLILKKVYHK